MKPLLLMILFYPSVLLAGRDLGPGLSYQRETSPQMHLFRVDLAKFRPRVLLAKDYGKEALTARRYRERSGAALVINGGFFDDTFHSLGLLVRDGQVLNPGRKSAWGVFRVLGGVADILAPRLSTAATSAELALQCGPRLVVQGEVQKMKESLPARRSAVGIDSGGQVLIAVADEPLPMADWARALQGKVVEVLNLDGGGSTQISVQREGFSLEVVGETGVPNALAILPKTLP